MKRIILGLAICLTTLGIAGVASAHPPRYVRVFERPIITPAVVVAPTPVVVAPPVEIVRPIYHHYGHMFRR
jgi:hypothetical protein